MPALLRRAGLGDAREDRVVGIAAIVGTLCFALHPLHVESLCLVSSRSEILAGLGFGIALATWIRGAERGTKSLQVIGLALGTAIACLAKEIGVLVPPAVVLVDLLVPRLPVGIAAFREAYSRLWRALLGAAPAFTVVLGYLVLRKALFGVATASLRAVSGGVDPYSGGGRDLATQLECMALFLPKALAMLVAPWSLSLDHTLFFGLGWSSPHVLAGAAAIALLLLLAVVGFRRRPLFAIATLVGFAFALPWIFIPLNVPFAEHRLYVPMLLITAPCAALFVRCARAAAASRVSADASRLTADASCLDPSASRSPRDDSGWSSEARRLPPDARRVRFAGIVATAILSCFAARSLAQQWTWRSKGSLWASTLRANPKSFRALASLADVASKEGRPAHACRLLERGNGLYSRYWPLRHQLLDVRVQIANATPDRSGDVAAASRRFVERTLELAHETVEDRPKDPFVRLLVAKAYRARYLHSNDVADLRLGESWALSCLAMVEQKMLVFRTAAEVVRAGGAIDAALALFEASRERGLVNHDFEAHEASLLVEARELERADRVLARLRATKPLDPVVLSLDAKSAAAQGQTARWRRSVEILSRLGYAVAELPRPVPSTQRSGSPAKPPSAPSSKPPK